MFRSHVTWCAQHVRRAGNRAFCLDQSGQAEIGKMRFALCIKQNVSGFDVPMQNAVLVGIMNRARQLCDEFRRATNRYRLAPDHFVQLAAFDQIHAKVATTVAFADFVNWNDGWMV